MSVINPPLCIDSPGRRCICQNEISGSSRQRRRGLRQPLAITSFTCHSPPTFSLSMPACPQAKTTRAAPSPRCKQGTCEATCMCKCRRQHTNAQTKCDMKDCICCPKGDVHRARAHGFANSPTAPLAQLLHITQDGLHKIIHAGAVQRQNHDFPTNSLNIYLRNRPRAERILS